MTYKCIFYQPDLEVPIDLDSIGDYKLIPNHFRNYNWEEELRKEADFFAPTYEILNVESQETLTIKADNHQLRFQITYKKISGKSSTNSSTSIAEFAEMFNLDQATKIVAQFLKDPNLLDKYSKKNLSGPINLDLKESYIAWLAYGLILVFLLFVEFSLLREYGIGKASIILGGFIALVTFVMITYRPKK